MIKASISDRSARRAIRNAHFALRNVFLKRLMRGAGQARRESEMAVRSWRQHSKCRAIVIKPSAISPTSRAKETVLADGRPLHRCERPENVPLSMRRTDYQLRYGNHWPRPVYKAAQPMAYSRPHRHCRPLLGRALVSPRTPKPS